MPSPPRKTALLIGNGLFKDRKLSALTAPSADVGAFRKVLEDPSIGGFGEVQVLEDASFSEASAAIGRLFGVQSKEDLIVLYYSGHGLPDERGHLYLATRDTNTTHPDGTAIHAAEIKRMMEKSRSRRQVLVLDCCYSGAFGTAKGQAQLPIGAETFFTQGFGQHVLTASRSVELAYVGEQEIEGVKTSLFTHFLVQGLETGEAAREGRELVSVRDLYEYAFDGVTRHTNKMQPQMWVDDGQGDLEIARNPEAYRLPDKLERMLTSEERFDREGAVRILGQWLESSNPAQRHLAARVLDSHNKNERDRDVAIALGDVRRTSAAPDEAATPNETIAADETAATLLTLRAAERAVARLRLIAGLFFVLAIGAVAVSVYLGLQLTEANVGLDKAQEESIVLQAELRKMTTEHDKAQVALAEVTADRDETQAALRKMTTEHDKAQAEVKTLSDQREAANESLARAIRDIESLQGMLETVRPFQVP